MRRALVLGVVGFALAGCKPRECRSRRVAVPRLDKTIEHMTLGRDRFRRDEQEQHSILTQYERQRVEVARRLLAIDGAVHCVADASCCALDDIEARVADAIDMQGIPDDVADTLRVTLTNLSRTLAIAHMEGRFARGRRDAAALCQLARETLATARQDVPAAWEQVRGRVRWVENKLRIRADAADDLLRIVQRWRAEAAASEPLQVPEMPASSVIDAEWEREYGDALHAVRLYQRACR